MADLFQLNYRDFVKGLLVAVLSSVLTLVYTTIQSGSLAFDYKQILLVAVSSGLGYVLKNLFSDNQGRFLGKV